jgi:hypothetical protein
MNMEAPLITPLTGKNERAYKRGNGGQMIANNEYRTEFRTEYFYIMIGISGRVGRALARDALCHGFDPCPRCIRGMAVDFGPKQSGWLINQLDNPSFIAMLATQT